jgi:phosphoribosylformylglycinamidine synthase
MGASALAQVMQQLGNATPDVDSRKTERLLRRHPATERDGKLLAYHDRSDGGLYGTLTKWPSPATGLSINLDMLTWKAPLRRLGRCQELGRPGGGTPQRLTLRALFSKSWAP